MLSRPGLIFLSLIALDIASHWLQMYRYSSDQNISLYCKYGMLKLLLKWISGCWSFYTINTYDEFSTFCYSTFLVGKTSHKDVKDSSNWLFRAYYGNRYFMGYCCVSCEVNSISKIWYYCPWKFTFG